MKRQNKPVPEWTLADFKAEAAQVLGAKRGDPDIDIGAMMLCAAVTGCRQRDIVERIGPLTDAMRDAHRALRSSGVFRDRGKIRANWFGEDGVLEFCLDVAVADGLLVRT